MRFNPPPLSGRQEKDPQGASLPPLGENSPNEGSPCVPLNTRFSRKWLETTRLLAGECPLAGRVSGMSALRGFIDRGVRASPHLGPWQAPFPVSLSLHRTERGASHH